MNRVDIRVGLSAGLITATATAGALIAIGRRSATVARPFNVIAGHLLGVQKSDAYGFVPAITIPGVAIHVLLTTLAAIAVVVVARRRFAPAWLASVAVAALSALVSVGIARRDGASLARVLPMGDLVLVYLIFAAALTLGIRLAFFERAAAPRVDFM